MISKKPKLFSVLLAVLFCLSNISIKAQVSPPQGSSQNGPVGMIDYNGAGFNVYWDGNVIRAFPLRNAYDNTPRKDYTPGKILEVKTKKGHPDILLVLLSGGVVIQYSLSNMGLGYTWDVRKRDTLGRGVGSNSWVDYQGDAYYALAANGIVAVTRDSGYSFQMDTTGLLTAAKAITLDSNQNVYALDSLGLLMQTPTGSTWSRITSYPGAGGQYLYCDRRNRLIVGSGNNVYVSANGGSSWTSGSLSAPAGRFGDDALGNIYTTNGKRAYRSSDGGATWTRVDAGITSLAVDTSLKQIINGLGGDTVLYAATAFGIFSSSDQGATWAQANEGVNSVPKGFWLFNNGRMAAGTDLGIFTKNASDTVWMQTYPTGGMFLADSSIQGDTLGNIYTILSWDSSRYQMPVKSADGGATWQPDTTGLSQLNDIQYSSLYYDEYGNGHIAGYITFSYIYMVLSKAPGGNWVPDTVGLGNLNHFGGNFVFVSDHRGYVYTSCFNTGNLNIWRRPVTGGTWLPDTIGQGTSYFMQRAVYDNNGGVLALNSLSSTSMFHSTANGWTQVPFPTTHGFVNIVTMAGAPGGGIIGAFLLYNVYGVPTGLFCTQDMGITWNIVPGFDSSAVYDLETFGDTTYILSASGVFKMTCNGVVINPSGVVTVSKEEDMKLYPNPANGLCHIEMNDVKENATLIISDLEGREIKTMAITGAETVFSTNKMNAGIYMCRVISNGEEITVRKLVIE